VGCKAHPPQVGRKPITYLEGKSKGDSSMLLNHPILKKLGNWVGGRLEKGEAPFPNHKQTCNLTAKPKYMGEE
jgi:hypothetical protein